MTLELLDDVYAGFDRLVRRPHDVSGVLRVQDRKLVAKWIAKAEKAFPQLYFSVATVSLKNEQQIRSYGFWLMNRGRFEDIPETAREDGCVLIVIDVNRKEVCLHLGYLLDRHMKEAEAFEALSSAHPHLLESNYLGAIQSLLGGVSKYMKRLRSQARRRGAK